MRNCRTSVRFLYSVALVAIVFAAWLALSRLPNGNRTTATTAEVLDAQTRKSPDLMRSAKLIVAKTSQLREEQGLTPVEVNDQLVNTARYFANYLARTDKFSHAADGQTPAERASAHGYEYCLVAENIAYVSS